MHQLLVRIWREAEIRQHWQVGRYVIMPDHVHFFCAAQPNAADLSTFVGKWKEWTAKFAARDLGVPLPLWQEEFFDHLTRSSESYAEKWEYICTNPVRAGLAVGRDEWPFQGALNDLHVD